MRKDTAGNASPSGPHLHFAVNKLGPDKMMMRISARSEDRVDNLDGLWIPSLSS